MFQTVIYNTNAEKSIIEKTADSLGKLAIAVNQTMIGQDKSAIQSEKSAIEQQKYNEPTKDNIFKVYDEIDNNQIFGTKEIEEILDCSASTARAIMAKLKEVNVVEKVIGKVVGKGKYVFKTL